MRLKFALDPKLLKLSQIKSTVRQLSQFISIYLNLGSNISICRLAAQLRVGPLNLHLTHKGLALYNWRRVSCTNFGQQKAHTGNYSWWAS